MTTAAIDTVNYVNENRRPIHSAVLFSSFPDDVIQKTKDELLTRFGVDIQEVLPVERQRGIKGAMERNQLVLIHHEMGSHKDTGRVKKLAKSMEKDAIPISRKSSAWEEQLRYRLAPLAALPTAPNKRVVPDENMDNFLKEYTSLKGKGYSLAQMLEPLSKYRTEGKFERSQQLAIVVARLGVRAPSWFREWEKGFVEPQPLPVEGAEATGLVTPEVTEVIPEKPAEAVKPPVIHEDSLELARLYQGEADMLRAQLVEVQEQNKHLAAGGKAWASKVIDAVKLLVDEGVVSKENGFEMIAKAVGK